MNNSVINNFLDGIDEELIGITGESAEVCKEQSQKLRKELEENQKRTDEDINVRAATLAANVELIKSGVEITQSSFDDLKRKMPQMKAEKRVPTEIHVTAKGATVSKEMMLQIIEGFKASLELAKEKDSVESRKIIDSVKNTFDGYEYVSQELDLKIAEAQYELMKKYLQNGEMEEASEYSKTFGMDMRIHIKNKLLEKIKDEAIISSPELFIELTKYLSGEKTIEVNDLNFWKTMIEIETGKKLEEKEETPKKQEEKKEKTKTEISREDKKKYRIIKVRYDKKEPDGINKKDYAKLKETLRKERSLLNKDKKIKIVFEEGITSIPDGCLYTYSYEAAYKELDGKYGFGIRASEKQSERAREKANNALGNFVEEIQLPTTLTDIGTNVFFEMMRFKIFKFRRNSDKKA